MTMLLSNDNELYNSKTEEETTLTEYSSFTEYFSTEEKATACNDLPPTHEERSAFHNTEAPKEKSSLKKIIKMLKLTAATIATVSIAGISFAGATNTGKIPNSFNYKWPGISYVDREYVSDDEWGLYSTSFHTEGERSNEVQFSINGVAYRLEDPSKSLAFIWSYSGKGNARIIAHDYLSSTGYTISLSVDPYSADETDPENAYGTISSTSGSILYLEASSHYYKGKRITTSSELSALMYQLLVRSRIDSPGEWGKVMLGDKLYSDLDETWSGHSTPYLGGAPDFEFILFSKNAGELALDEAKGTLVVNDITWSLYLQNELHIEDEYHQNILWIIPDVKDESLILGIQYDSFIDYCNNALSSSKETQEVYGSLSEEVMLSILEEKLLYYHIAPSDWYIE